MKIRYSVRDIVETAVLVAIAIVLDLQGLKIQLFAAGGSISFTMVPLIILVLRVGPLKGFVGVGIIYGLITCLLDGHGFMYYPFDYLLAYGSIAFLGFFRTIIFDKNNQIYGVLSLILGMILVFIFRFVFHSISSMIFYSLPLIAAIIYNAPYVFISGALCIIAMLILYKPLQIINEKYPYKSIC